MQPDQTETHWTYSTAGIVGALCQYHYSVHLYTPVLQWCQAVAVPGGASLLEIAVAGQKHNPCPLPPAFSATPVFLSIRFAGVRCRGGALPRTPRWPERGLALPRSRPTGGRCARYQKIVGKAEAGCGNRYAAVAGWRAYEGPRPEATLPRLCYL